MMDTVEYVALRLIRRIMPETLLKTVAFLVPHYQRSLGETDPRPVVAEYQRWLAEAGVKLEGKRVVEIGCGATNGTGYGLVCSGASTWTGIEPFQRFDARADHAQKHLVEQTHNRSIDPAAIVRMRDITGVADAGADLVLSNSVLEHVKDCPALFSQCQRILAPGGAMLHIVDYRDHFFKYPYHFLLFGERVWKRWLNPGDLFRYRVGDHVEMLQTAGFPAKVLETRKDEAGYEKVRGRIHEQFHGRSDDDLSVAFAVLFCKLAGAP